MNKKLIALAVSSAFAGAVAAPVAMADDSSVTIYGSASVSVDYVSGTSASSPFDGSTTFAACPSSTAVCTPALSNATTGSTDREHRARISSNNSYLGFKGKEDLGNGLAAIWQLESAIDFTRQNGNDVASSDTVYKTGNTGVLSGRNSFVGLSSKSWGEVTLGLQDTPLKTSTGKLDYFKDTLADYRTLFTTNNGSQRATNSIQYASPDFSGFSFKALTASKNVAGNGQASNPHQYSMSATYDKGPLFVVGAYENTKQTLKFAPATLISDVVTQKTWRLGAGYKFGDFTVAAAYENEKQDGNATAATYNTKRNSWNAGASYAVTKANVIKVQYTHLSDCTGTQGKGVSGVATGGSFCSGASATTQNIGSDTGANQWSLGVDHSFSKRTKLYALYTRVSNDNRAAYSLGGGASGITPVNSQTDGNASGLSIGMVHSF